LSAYLEVERAAWLRGRGRRPSETVPRHLHRLSPEDRQSTAPLASLYNRARFSAHRVSADDAARAERAGREIQRGLG
ncbi:MAG: DUF4129 domain-containing protein, partial [Actinomycetota bacterium]